MLSKSSPFNAVPSSWFCGKRRKSAIVRHIDSSDITRGYCNSLSLTKWYYTKIQKSRNSGDYTEKEIVRAQYRRINYLCNPMRIICSIHSYDFLFLARVSFFCRIVEFPDVVWYDYVIKKRLANGNADDNNTVLGFNGSRCNKKL